MEEIKSGIYAIRCCLNNHEYIGSAVNIPRRWSEHRHDLRRGTHHSPALQHAWNKHGEEAFTFIVLERVANPKRLIPIEQTYLDRCKPEYNCNPQARSGLGSKRGKRPLTEKQRVAHAEQRGKPKPQPFSEKQQAHLQAIIEANRTKSPTLWQRAGWNSLRGRTRTEAQRARQREAIVNSEAHKAYRAGPRTENQIAALHANRAKSVAASVAARRGKALSAEHRAKISASLEKQDASSYPDKRLSGMRAYNERRHAKRLAREQAQQNSPIIRQPGLWDEAS